MRPMYREIAENLEYAGEGNAGLWYDKFCDKWHEHQTKARGQSSSLKTILSLSSTKQGSPKEQWIRTVTTKGPVGDRNDLSEATHRLRSLTKALGGLALELTTESSFVTGLGRSHPVENGFAWHHTLGVPYLPGSSIKGLMRTWARSESLELDGEISRWFGDAGRVGRMCFLDAIPVEPVPLGVDIMTPHYAGWSVSSPPGDWMSPTPIPFLVVKPGARFLFCMLPQISDSVTAEESHTLKLHLTEALKWLGAGAKTAVGYGRFTELPSVQRSTPQHKVELKVGAIVTAKLLEERTKKGGWKAEEVASGKIGHIENTSAVPSDKEAGDTVKLEIRAVHADGALTFRWP